MVRTRDFLLLISTIVFLLVAIGATVFSGSAPTGERTNDIIFVDDSDVEISATTPDTLEQMRVARLAEMRSKIASDQSLYMFEEEQQPVPQEEEPSETILVEEMRCVDYSPFMRQWDSANVSITEQEGIRFVHKEVQGAQSTTTVLGEIMVELPVRSAAFGAQYCLQSDVVGITLNGGLIRNSDAALYAPAGTNVLLGYALDGFPIYGTTGESLDTCGGRVVAGQYRYQLSPDKDFVIGCFSATPTSL